MLLFGDWKNPNPAPQSISLQTMSPCEGFSGNQASRKSPAAMAVSPTPPSSPAWTRSTSSPATGATIMMMAGQAVSSSPVSTSLYPQVCCR